MVKKNKDTNPNPLKTFILGLFTFDRGDGFSGYDLGKIMEDMYFDHYIKGNRTALYYHLKSLDKNKLVKSKSIKDSNRPERTIYKITTKGQAKLGSMITELLENIQDYYFDLDAIMPFLLLVDKKKILELINKQIASKKEYLKYIDEVTIPRIKSAPLIDLNPFSLLIPEHHRLHYEAEVAFLEKFYKMVEDIDFSKNIAEILKRNNENKRKKLDDKKIRI